MTSTEKPNYYHIHFSHPKLYDDPKMKQHFSIQQYTGAQLSATDLMSIFTAVFRDEEIDLSNFLRHQDIVRVSYCNGLCPEDCFDTFESYYVFNKYGEKLERIGDIGDFLAYVYCNHVPLHL